MSIVPTVDEIIDATAIAFHIDRADILVADRHRKLARPRQIIMYLAREMTTQSFPEIGRRIGRDHTTVVHGARKIGSLMGDDRVADKVGGARIIANDLALERVRGR